MRAWSWCARLLLLLLPLLPLLRPARTQAEGRVTFLPGAPQNVTMGVNQTLQAVAAAIPVDVAFVTLQFHTQDHNATLSYYRVLRPGSFLTAVDSGLLSALQPAQMSVSWFLSSPAGTSVTGTGLVLSYSSTDPVPGACNMEFNLEVDPNVYVRYNLYETTIRFAPANLGSDRGVTPPPCDASTGADTRWRLQYDVYQYFLPENDLSQHSLFSAIQAVADVRGLTQKGRRVMTLSFTELTLAAFTSIPGQGVVYSVVVRDPLLNSSASYLPAHTYACSFASTLDNCRTLGRTSPAAAVVLNGLVTHNELICSGHETAAPARNQRRPRLNPVNLRSEVTKVTKVTRFCLSGRTSTKVLFTLTGLAGLFVCFFGHRFFKCELFCMGFGFAAFFFFVLITRTAELDYNLRLVLSAVIGVLGGVVLVMSWWRFGSVMACVVVVGLMLGFLVASLVLFTPLGDLDVFRRSDVVFWVTFCSVLLVVPLFFVRWPREGNILTCGVLGAYAVVLAVNAYVYTSLSYITLNILKRFLNSNFSAAFTDVPFQTIDFVMITVWVVLGVGGIVLQLHRERTRPFFPPSPYLMWQQERERRETNVLDPSHHFPSLPNRLLARVQQLSQRKEAVGEHTPLLL